MRVSGALRKLVCQMVAKIDFPGYASVCLTTEIEENGSFRGTSTNGTLRVPDRPAWASPMRALQAQASLKSASLLPPLRTCGTIY